MSLHLHPSFPDLPYLSISRVFSCHHSQQWNHLAPGLLKMSLYSVWLFAALQLCANLRSYLMEKAWKPRRSALGHCGAGVVKCFFMYPISSFLQLLATSHCHDFKWNKPKLDCRLLIHVDPGKEPQTKRQHLAV